MTTTSLPAWRRRMPAALRPYLEAAPLGALLLGVSSGFPYAMIGATLTRGWRRTGSTSAASPPSRSPSWPTT
jgi:PAT family beta-lactamase induction signal transducer AmpG